MSQAPLSVGPVREIILFVQDMNRQVSFYRDTLGLEVAYPAGLEDYDDQFWVVFHTGACALALHGGGENRFGEDAPKVVFSIDDPEAARAALQQEKVPVSEIRSPAPGIEVFDARDPEGNVFSLEKAGNA